MQSAALVHRVSFDERLPWLAGLHTPDEDRWFFRKRVYSDCVLWGAVEGDVLLGIIGFRKDWIDQLHMLPHAQGRGAGTSLLNVAKSQAETLSLWTFRRNVAACRFHERRAFIKIEETDGSGNDEREPEAVYRWRAQEQHVGMSACHPTRLQPLPKVRCPA